MMTWEWRPANRSGRVSAVRARTAGIACIAPKVVANAPSAPRKATSSSSRLLTRGVGSEGWGRRSARNLLCATEKA